MEWQEVVLIVLGVLLLLAGGYIQKLAKEVKDLVDVFSAAIADKKVTKEELESIIKEAKDVKAITLEIIGLLNRKQGS